MAELIQPLPESDDVPRGFGLLDYHLIEERTYPPAELQDPSPVASLFLAEQSQNLDELRQATGRLIAELAGDENESLRQAFAVFLQSAIVPTVAPGMHIPEIKDLLELKTMLEQRAIEWRESWREEGRKEGQAGLLLRQMQKKFGQVPDDVQARLAAADAEQLLDWAERLVTAETVEEVFDGSASH